ncbi:MAG: DUF1893 domain-containing protein [Lentisphaeria bacterium]|nr:DUF1893 domain-containing protein [Lentisphaeria bacterium]
MKNLFTAILLFALCAVISGCSTEFLVRESARMIKSGNAECVVVKNNTIATVEKGRGVSPLLNIYRSKPECMNGGIVVDKVIGRAAAFIIISGKAAAAHGELVSEDAIELLKKHNIPVTSSKTVPRILNRRMDDICPLEKSVQGINDPVQAMDALQKCIEKMTRN